VVAAVNASTRQSSARSREIGAREVDSCATSARLAQEPARVRPPRGRRQHEALREELAHEPPA
jgi:hypothetical protein